MKLIREMHTAAAAFELPPGAELEKKELPPSEQPIHRPNTAERRAQQGHRAPSPSARQGGDNNHVPVSVITPGMRARNDRSKEQQDPNADPDVWEVPHCTSRRPSKQRRGGDPCPKRLL